MNKLKQEYNYNLARYVNGCNYCEKNRNEIDKWIPELMKILNNMNNVLKEIMKKEKVSEEEILKGFKMKEE